MLIDEPYFIMMREKMMKRFQLILDAYVEESESIINEFKLAGEQNDIETMIRAVHSLKSSSASLGAQQISELSAKLEEQYQSGITENWEGEWKELNETYQQTIHKMIALNESLAI